MRRRNAIAALLGAGSQALAPGAARMDRLFGPAPGTALLLNFRTRRLIAVHNAGRAREWLLPPGSTLKPFSLLALIESGKLAANEPFVCPRQLTIGGRSFGCSHPPVGTMHTATAIAYSCNCFVAQFAQRFEFGELAGYLAQAAFRSRTEHANTAESCQLQATGYPFHSAYPNLLCHLLWGFRATN